MSMGHVVKSLEKQLSIAQRVIDDLVRENYELKSQLTTVVSHQLTEARQNLVKQT